MKIVIPGGSGQVGTILARAFHGLEDGFRFRFPDWEDAARDLYRRWKVTRSQKSGATWGTSSLSPPESPVSPFGPGL